MKKKYIKLNQKSPMSAHRLNVFNLNAFKIGGLRLFVKVDREPGRLRVGLVTSPWSGRGVEPAVREATPAAGRLMESLGHQVEVEVTVADLGVGWEEFVFANARLWSANLVRWIDGFAGVFGRPVDGSTVEPEMLASYEWGRKVSGAEFVHAVGVRNRVARSVAAQFAAGQDVPLTPTLPEVWVALGTYGRGRRMRTGWGGWSTCSSARRSPPGSTSPVCPRCRCRSRHRYADRGPVRCGVRP
ncbi:hypothetical protein ACFWP3_30140 [Streptomyces sp. NPDC058525]|uniref:hypothetical protein n=1 Tax=Streptomyces sp. NPDC058525 TaxID=3346538 RepID=UPI003658B579